MCFHIVVVMDPLSHFKQRAIHTLPGKCNVRDISDILLALDTCLSMGIGSEGSLGVLGGSYGGCLSLQLIAHQPSRFSCCAHSHSLTLTYPFMCWFAWLVVCACVSGMIR